MGLAVSTLVCNTYMEEVEETAIVDPDFFPFCWYRYMDDTHTQLDAAQAQVFTDHLSSLDPRTSSSLPRGRRMESWPSWTPTQRGKRIDLLKMAIYKKSTDMGQ